MPATISDNTKEQIHAAWLNGGKQRALAKQFGVSLGTIGTTVNGICTTQSWRARRMTINVARLVSQEQPEQRQSLSEQWYQLGEDAVLLAISRARRAQKCVEASHA